MMSAPPADRASLRIDKWLWFARLARTRSLAARLCAAGAVAVSGGVVAKAHQPVRVGDVVRVPRGRLVLTIRVVALGTRRGSAAEARALYAEAPPARPLAEPAPAWTPLLDDGAEAEA